MKDYREFASKFAASGLTQEAFGRQEGMSASMVSYYIRKSRQDKRNADSSFLPIKIIDPAAASRVLSITYGNGTQIKIPL